MEDRSDIVVIGGGIMGVSLARHLAAADIGSVRLIERDGIAQGTTAAGAGFIAPWAAGFFPTYGDEEAAAEYYALDLYRRMDAEGHDIDYAQNGFLWVAPDDDAWQKLEHLAMFEGRAEREIVAADRIEELTGGVIPAGGVQAGVYLPEAAQISAAKAAIAMAREFELAGGRIDCRRPAIGLEARAGRVTGVRTATGSIGCSVALLAAGVWNRELLAPLGVFLPTVPLVTSRIITEPLGVPRAMPALFLSGLSAISALWVREHHGALMWGGHYRTAPEKAFVDSALPERFDHVALDGVFEAQRMGEEAARFMPLLNRYQSVTVAHGAPCFTADLRSLVGPVPGVDGLHVVAGDNEAGVTHAPGYGKFLAEFIANGSRSRELAPWRVDRFGSQFTREEQVISSFNSVTAG